MATAAVQLPHAAGTFDSPAQRSLQDVRVEEKQTTTKGRDVPTTLNYYKAPADGSPPHATYIDKPETYDRPVEEHLATIYDLNGREGEFFLDLQGFQIIKNTAEETEFLDDEHIKAVYYPETERLLKNVTGASRVFIFDHTIRRQLPVAAGGQPDRALRGPVQRVHIDQSYQAALSRVPHHLPDEAEELLRGRVQIINVWRPVGRPVARDPLAVADARTVAEEDLVPTPLIYPTRRGETYQVHHAERHRWYYKDGLAPDEVLLIKCFDSKQDGRARRVPHTAFVDPAAGHDVPPRQSIEVRALVFHPEDTE